MSRIHVGTFGPSDWRARLASPERHWKRGRSALELAVSWERVAGSTNGIPAEVAKVLAMDSRLADSRLLFGVVEHKVPLPGGSRPSQNDLWALIASPSGLISSLTIEGKAGEKFDDTVEQWLAKSKDNSGRLERLQFLATALGLATPIPGIIRYQLLHRTASALIEATRFRAGAAVMLVQSFAQDREAELDFRAFTTLLGREVGPNECREVRQVNGVPLVLGWASSEPASDRQIADSLGAI